jgi:hypothetical protein
MENTPEAEKEEAGQEDNQPENPEVNKAEAEQKDLSQPVKPEELTSEPPPPEGENHVHEGGSSLLSFLFFPKILSVKRSKDFFCRLFSHAAHFLLPIPTRFKRLMTTSHVTLLSITYLLHG